MFCEKCGKKLEENTLFCDKCGTKVEKGKNKKEEHISYAPISPKPKKGKTIFLSILSVVLIATTVLFLVLWLTKGSSCNSGENGGNGGSGNGGGTAVKEKRTPEYLFDQYVKAYTKADIDAARDIFPPFYVRYAKNSLTKEKLETSLKNAKKEYGNDFNITYKITDKIKMDEDELEELNDDLEKYYDADVRADECYILKGTITFKGSKYEDPDPIDSTRYCKFDGTWYFVQG